MMMVCDDDEDIYGDSEGKYERGEDDDSKEERDAKRGILPVKVVMQSACIFSSAVRAKAVTVDVEWLINGFSSRATKFDRLFSQNIEVKCGKVVTRWYLTLHMGKQDEIGLYLSADEKICDVVEHRAHMKFTLGEGDAEISEDDYDQAPSEFTNSEDGNDWGFCMPFKSNALLNDRMFVKLSLTVYHSHREDFECQTETLETLFQDQMGDFTVHCDGKDIKVMKKLLAKTSPVLEAMLSSGLKEVEDGVLTIKDLDYDTVKDMLQFAYTGILTDKMNVGKLLKAADKYLMESLKQQCSEQLISLLCLENACRYLVLGEMFSAPSLKDAATNLIRKLPDEAKATEGWKTFITENESLVKHLFPSDDKGAEKTTTRKRKHEN